MQKSIHRLNNCSVIILAAGRSSRMGMPKFALQFTANKTFLDEIIEQYSIFGCKKIVVIVNKEGLIFLQKQSKKYAGNIAFIENTHLDWERFYSIKLGIQNVENNFPVFIHNVDNPFIDQKVLEKLYSHSSEDYIVPVFNGKGGHPILLSQNIAEEILKEKKNDLIFSGFLKKFEKTRIDVEDKNILVNINTREEYEKRINRGEGRD